jgi:hypothetical protein
MDPFRLLERRARPAAVALGLAAALAAVLAVPARAVPGQPGPVTLATARAEAARLQQEVARLDLRVEDLAGAHSATQARLDGLIQRPTGTRRPWSGPSWPSRRPGPPTPATSVTCTPGGRWRRWS